MANEKQIKPGFLSTSVSSVKFGPLFPAMAPREVRLLRAVRARGREGAPGARARARARHGARGVRRRHQRHEAGGGRLCALLTSV